MANPHNKNSTAKIDEKEALKQFLDDLKKNALKDKNISKEKEIELATIFKEKVEDLKKEKNNKSLELGAKSNEKSHDQNSETDKINSKLEKIENELGVADLDDAVNYYAGLADKGKNSTSRA